jgi:hypothetical protein
MGRGSRGSAKKLCFTSLRQVIEKELANWEGVPFFHSSSFANHIAPLYWRQAKANGHYKLQNNYGTKTTSGSHCISNRLAVPITRILKSLGCKRMTYGRLHERQDRFGYRIKKGQSMWLLPNAELPPSSYGAFTRRVNFNQEEE